VILLYTDGVTDAINRREEAFGQDRLIEVVADNRELTAEDLVERIRAAVDSFVGGARQFDDLTLLALKYIDEELWTGLCRLDESSGQPPPPPPVLIS
jgi:sigma-B regulation protein RsbU (phosphoserine phosphatase)